MNMQVRPASGARGREKRIGPWAKSLFAAGVAILVAACGSSVNYDVPPEAYSAPISGTMSVGDNVQFTFPGAPEYNQSQKIQPDGRVGLPMIGMVNAAGRSTSALQASLTDMYAEHLNDPTVFITVTEPAASVYVTGEVAGKGKVPLTRKMSVLEAIMEKGGFSKLANPKKVYVIRTEGNTQKRYVLNLADPLKGYESEAFYVRPYDVIYVERSNW